MLHGGEPLLLGHDGLRGVIRTLRSLIDPVTRLDLRIHTNGVLLDERLCALFADYARPGGRVAGWRSRGQRPAPAVCQRPEQLSTGTAGTFVAEEARVQAPVHGHPVHRRRGE